MIDAVSHISSNVIDNSHYKQTNRQTDKQRERDRETHRQRETHMSGYMRRPLSRPGQ